jgi:uncharacterized protein
MKRLLILILSSTALGAFGQENLLSVRAEIVEFQKELNEEFKDSEKSPLENKDRRKFTQHDFFDIDLSYRTEATLTLASVTDFFVMKTTTDRLPEYRIYGIIDFEMHGKHFSVPVYQSKDLMNRLEYKDYLFFPFTDLTNVHSSYGGGRYIELRIPEAGNKIIVDFNQAYNPYCAYSSRFSCPIVPKVNHLDIEIKAGVRYDQKKRHATE